jgi:hypothetical protein
MIPLRSNEANELIFTLSLSKLAVILVVMSCANVVY